jgi:hypothetical protein
MLCQNAQCRILLLMLNVIMLRVVMVNVVMLSVVALYMFFIRVLFSIYILYQGDLLIQTDKPFF